MTPTQCGVIFGQSGLKNFSLKGEETLAKLERTLEKCSTATFRYLYIDYLHVVKTVTRDSGSIGNLGVILPSGQMGINVIYVIIH